MYDVVIVYLVCALPLAWMLAAFVQRRVPAPVAVVLALVLLGLLTFPLLDRDRESDWAAIVSHPLQLTGLRAALSLGLTLPVALLAAVLLGGRPSWNLLDEWVTAGIAVGLGIAVLLLIPWTYVGARCRHDAARFDDLLRQSRFGEARTHLHRLRALGMQTEWNGHPLSEVASPLERTVRALEDRVSVPLANDATTDAQLDRARSLAMLGRTEEALTVLQVVRSPAVVAEVDTLRGTIHEARGEWAAGLAGYRSARVAWEARPPSPAREGGLLRATMGIAYCQRKAGQYVEAEKTYAQLLELSPTAEAHFLLAQFYEDAQHAENARKHARRAMALAPARYTHEGEKLIRKLRVYHFGCLRVTAAEFSDP